MDKKDIKELLLGCGFSICESDNEWVYHRVGDVFEDCTIVQWNENTNEVQFFESNTGVTIEDINFLITYAKQNKGE